MSYILDALKKAERERQLARVPTLETVHVPGPSPRRQLWPWVVAGALLANVAILIVLLRPSPPSVSLKSADSGGTGATARPAVVSERPVPEQAADQGSDAGSDDKTALAAAPSPAARPRVNPASPAEGRPMVDKQGGAAKAASPSAVARAKQKPTFLEPIEQATGPLQERAAASAPASRERRPPEQGAPLLPSVNEMPPALQGVIPRLRLDALVYSDVPTERIVFINGRKYVERERVDANVVVEGITPEGAILSYQGQRFLLRARLTGP